MTPGTYGFKNSNDCPAHVWDIAYKPSRTGKLDGSISAAIALERALRLEDPADDGADDELDELDRDSSP